MVRLSRLKSKYIPSYKEPSQEEQLNRLAEGEELFNAHLAESEERRRRFEELKNDPKMQEKRKAYQEGVKAKRDQKIEESKQRLAKEKEKIEARKQEKQAQLEKKQQDFKELCQIFDEEAKTKDIEILAKDYAENFKQNQDLYKYAVSVKPEICIYLGADEIFNYNFFKKNSDVVFENFDIIKQRYGTVKIVKFFNYIYRKDEILYEDILDKLTGLDNKNIMPYYLWGSVCENNGYIKLELFDQLLSESDKDLLFRNDEFLKYNHDRILSHYPAIFKSLSRETIEGNMRFVDFFNERYYSSSETQKTKLEKLWKEKIPTLVLGGQEEIQKLELSEQERIERDIENYGKYQAKVSRIKNERYRESRGK